MSMIGNELSFDELEKVCGSGFWGSGGYGFDAFTVHGPSCRNRIFW